MKDKKIYVVGGAIEYAKWINNYTLVDSLEDANIVLFTGGEDVDPSIYGCEKHHTTCSNINRDLYEKEIFEKVRKDQLCIGICRGSQFLCAINGGILVQDVNNHAIFGTHRIINVNNDMDKYEITSTHHQMQYPFNLRKGKDYKVLYYAARRGTYYGGDKVDIIPCEPEIVLYTVEGNPKCLAIQGHPEFMRKEAPVISMLNNLIDKYL